MKTVLRAGQIASKAREQKCAQHLKHLLPKNIVLHYIETSDDATLQIVMSKLDEILRFLSLAALILQDVDQGKTGVARLLRKPRIYADRIIGKIPSDEVVTRMVLGRAETHAGSAAHTNEIMRVPFVDKVAISIFGLVPANDIWPDTKQHPEVYDLKQFFDLAVLIGRLSLGEIVTTSRLMVERLYWEMGNQSEDVEGKKWFVELRAARQLMFSILATYTTKQSWDHVKTQMEADGSEITIIPNMNRADIVPII